jgi:hypothetical protein
MKAEILAMDNVDFFNASVKVWKFLTVLQLSVVTSFWPGFDRYLLNFGFKRQ